MSKRATCPDGCEITGTVEQLSASCPVVFHDDGSWDFTGDETKLYWDCCETQEKDGEPLFLCANGDEWKRSELTLVDVEDDHVGA